MKSCQDSSDNSAQQMTTNNKLELLLRYNSSYSRLYIQQNNAYLYSGPETIYYFLEMFLWQNFIFTSLVEHLFIKMAP